MLPAFAVASTAPSIVNDQSFSANHGTNRVNGDDTEGELTARDLHVAKICGFLPSHVWRVLRFVCYPPYCFCNFPFPRMGCSLVGGKGKSCRCEILCYGIKGWIRQPVDENLGSIISTFVLIFARSWRKWRDASATVLCQKTVQLSRQRDAESAKWVMTSRF